MPLWLGHLPNLMPARLCFLSDISSTGKLWGLAALRALTHPPWIPALTVLPSSSQASPLGFSSWAWNLIASLFSCNIFSGFLKFQIRIRSWMSQRLCLQSLTRSSCPLFYFKGNQSRGEWSFPSGTSGKESPCQCRRHKRVGLYPWVGKIPWRRKWQPTPVFLPKETLGQKSLVSYSPQGDKRQILLKQLSAAQYKGE